MKTGILEFKIEQFSPFVAKLMGQDSDNCIVIRYRDGAEDKLNCGDLVEVKLKGVWVPTSIEKSWMKEETAEKNGWRLTGIGKVQLGSPARRRAGVRF